MAYPICATCRFYNAYGNGKGYCSLHGKDVPHSGKCSDHEED